MVPCPHLRGICSRLIKVITSKLWEAPHQCCLGTLALELGSCLHNRYILIWVFQIDLIFCQNGSDLPSGQTGVAPSVHVAVLESLHCPWWGLNQTCIDFHIKKSWTKWFWRRNFKARLLHYNIKQYIATQTTTFHRHLLPSAHWGLWLLEHLGHPPAGQAENLFLQSWFKPLFIFGASSKLKNIPGRSWPIRAGVRSLIVRTGWAGTVRTSTRRPSDTTTSITSVVVVIVVVIVIVIVVVIVRTTRSSKSIVVLFTGVIVFVRVIIFLRGVSRRPSKTAKTTTSSTTTSTSSESAAPSASSSN